LGTRLKLLRPFICRFFLVEFFNRKAMSKSRLQRERELIGGRSKINILPLPPHIQSRLTHQLLQFLRRPKANICAARGCAVNIFGTGRSQYERGNELYCSTTAFFSSGASARILVTAYPIRPSRSHSDTLYSAGVLWSSVISPKQWPLPYNAQRSQKTDGHASEGIQTHNPSQRAATDRCEVHSVMSFFVGRSSSLTDVCFCCICWNVMINRSTAKGT
jgi:hypothetical protein